MDIDAANGWSEWRGEGRMSWVRDRYSLEEMLDAVGAGWHPLLHKIWDAKPERVRIVQVKEKFGLLRVHIEVDRDARAPFRHEEEFEHFAQLVQEAEAASALCCEMCGAPASTTVVSGWYRTLCDVHRA